MNSFINYFEFAENRYYYFDLKKVFDTFPSLKQLPNSLKILLENTIRNAKIEELDSIIKIFLNKNNYKKVEFNATRIVMAEKTGISVFIDLIPLRENIKTLMPFDLILERNRTTTKNEINKEKERHSFIKALGKSFESLSLIPPNKQSFPYINLEYLSTVISLKKIEEYTFIYPENIICSDSFGSMSNALGVLSLKSSVLEIEACFLSSPKYLDFPNTIGIRLESSLTQGLSFLGISSKIEEILSERNLENKIIEFYGEGVKSIHIEDRAILCAIAQKYGALCGYFSMDESTIKYLAQTRGLDVSIIKEYFIKQGLYENNTSLEFDENILIDLSQIKARITSYKKLELEIDLATLPSTLESFRQGEIVKENDIVLSLLEFTKAYSKSLFVQVGLLAKKAYELGLSINSCNKRYLYIEDLSIRKYLEDLELFSYFEKLGFVIIENTDALEILKEVSLDIEKHNLNTVCLSTRNIDSQNRIHPLVKTTWQMSPSLILAYCLNGNLNFDITKEAINTDIYLSDIWPNAVEVNESLDKIPSAAFKNTYKDVFLGDETWINLENENFEYIQIAEDNDIKNIKDLEKIDINEAQILALLEEDFLSEDIVPSGIISPYSSAGDYLKNKGLSIDEFDIYENRYDNAEVLARGIFSGKNIKNKIVHPKEGAFTKNFTSSEIISLYDFSSKSKKENKSLILFANNINGKQSTLFAQGIKLLGVEVVVAKSFSQKHKEDLIRVGILPLEFIDEELRFLNLSGEELISIKTISLKENEKIEMSIKKDKEIKTLELQSKLETKEELEYFSKGGALFYYLNK